jgi:hypothetical protein
LYFSCCARGGGGGKAEDVQCQKKKVVLMIMGTIERKSELYGAKKWIKEMTALSKSIIK